MTRSLASGTPKEDSVLPPALAVRDDPVEAAEEALPRPRMTGRPPGQEVVRREDERRAGVQKPGIYLGRCDPLQVEDVAVRERLPREGERMLDALRGEP